MFSGHLAPSYVFAGALRHVTEAVHPRNMSSSPKPIEYGNADSEVTDRAIVQHLAKLRNRLDAEGVKVTPPLKRGGRATSIVPNAKAGNNNKTVSAKGSVAKRSGKFKTRAKQGHVNKEDDDEESDSEDAATRQGKGKSWYKKDKGQSGQVKVKAEQSDEGLKFSSKYGFSVLCDWLTIWQEVVVPKRNTMTMCPSIALRTTITSRTMKHSMKIRLLL